MYTIQHLLGGYYFILYNIYWVVIYILWGATLTLALHVNLSLVFVFCFFVYFMLSCAFYIQLTEQFYLNILLRQHFLSPFRVQLPQSCEDVRPPTNVA